MKDFIRGMQSIIGGAMMKTEDIVGWVMKRGDQVDSSNQSNFTP